MNDEESLKEFEEWYERLMVGKDHPRMKDFFKVYYKIGWLASRRVLFEKHPELMTLEVEPGCMDETED